MHYRSYYNPYRGTPIVILPIGHAPIVFLPIGKITIGVRNLETPIGPPIGVYTENFCPTDDYYLYTI
jgi:hypothetical protein